MEAQDYKKLVEALRCCSKDKCAQCEYGRNRNRGLCVYSILADAADAIEFLIKDRNFWKDAAIKAKEEN